LNEARPHRASKGKEPPPSAEDQRLVLENLLYRDETLAVLNKPPGLAVQGGSGQRRHLDALLRAWPESAEGPPDLRQLRLVHRLDRDTSGVLVLAQGAKNARILTRSFHDKTTRKIYWALVVGRPKKERGYINVPLASLAGSGGDKSRPDSEGQEALTLYRLVAQKVFNGIALSWFALMPVTGRKHQLRAHLASLGLPILGDGKYGGRKSHPGQLSSQAWASKLQLHAREIAIPHPEDGTTLRIAAPLPDHMASAWRELDWQEVWGEAAVDDLAGYSESLLPRLKKRAKSPGERRKGGRAHAR
jgi:23S rRNA pseudouridine955/2504/2580 synthase